MPKDPPNSQWQPSLREISTPQALLRTIQILGERIYSLHQTSREQSVKSAETSKKLDDLSPQSIADQISATGPAPVDLTGLVGRTRTSQYAYVPKFSIVPPLYDPSTGVGEGTLITVSTDPALNTAGLLYRFNQPFETFNPVQTIGIELTGTHAQRLASFAATNYEVGTIFYETDRTVLYVVLSVASVNTWVYQTGFMKNTLANIPVDLGTNDAGFLIDITDFRHILKWSGAAWGWGPGEPGSGMMVEFEVDPSPTTGWQLYDGTTISYLKSDGTTANVTLPDLVSAAGNAAYIKAGSPNAGPNAATAPGFTGSALGTHTHPLPISIGATQLFVDPSLGAGPVVNATKEIIFSAISSTPVNEELSGPTSAGTPAGTIDATGEPRNLVRRPWFRR